MELSIFENGVDLHNSKIQNAVQKDGLYVMHEKDYSYTVGMKALGAPELILFNQSREVAEEMFQVLFQAVQLGLVDLKQSGSIEHIFEPMPTIESVGEMNKRNHFYAARTYYGDWEFMASKISMDFH